ncbi:MAG: M48 family metallopeptidase [Saprospiraceae bacterium]|nr:M48 family metallopeptidase [Saprospiraceae bacterium]
MAIQNIESTSISIKNTQVPVRIHRERRRGARASIRHDAAVLRMPQGLPSWEEARHWQWFEDWVRKQLETHSHLLERFHFKPYQDGECIQVGEQQYHLSLEEHDGASHSARLQGGVVRLKLSSREQGLALRHSVRTLLSRIIGNDQLPALSRRVHELNALYFQQNILSVRLKYNRSNWGSCSRTGNINLSTRLLFAPPAVQDYVIIHELAHLLEFNHSKRFWEIVASADPDYKAHAAWLKQHGHTCEF